MGSERVYVYGDQVLVKPPRTAEKTVWHQDLPYNHVIGEQICAIRLPCQVETDEVGPVSYLPGSHADGTVYKVNFFISDGANPDDTGADIPEIVGRERDLGAVTCHPKPGDLVVHHLGTLHAAGANVSQSKTRQAITIRYSGDDARRLSAHLLHPKIPTTFRTATATTGTPSITRLHGREAESVREGDHWRLSHACCSHCVSGV